MMGKKSVKKQKSNNEETIKKNVKPSEVKTENTGKAFSEPTEEEILRIKEEHLVGIAEEEEQEEKKPDTVFRKIYKSLEYFFDYYKWYVIIPLVIIIIVVIFVKSYIEESKETTLEVTLMNTYDVLEVLGAIEDTYPEERGIDTSKKPIKVEYNIQYPKSSAEGNTFDDYAVACMQKFTAMLTAGKVDAAITNTWALDAYAEAETAEDLRNVFDEEFLEKYEDRIYYYTMSNGTTYPVGIFVDDCDFLGEFDEGEPPLIATFDTATHKEQAKDFICWVLEHCE